MATYVYDPGDRRDPFTMDVRGEDLAEPLPAGSIAPDPLRRKEELEQYALDSLKMVGTLAQADSNWALVRSPEGVLHKVRVGNYVGQIMARSCASTKARFRSPRSSTRAGASGASDRPPSLSRNRLLEIMSR